MTTQRYKIIFIIYLIVITWLILFKGQFSVSAIPYTRVLNYIPFQYEHPVDNEIPLIEALFNIVLFIPYGYLLTKIAPRLKFAPSLIIMMMTSVTFELLQYLLAVGVTDTTDVITNTLGGIVGILLTK